MEIIPEPEGVDFVVTGGITDPEAMREVAAWIAAHKALNDHSAEVEKAQEIIDAIKLNPRKYGLEEAMAVLERSKQPAGVAEAAGVSDGPCS